MEEAQKLDEETLTSMSEAMYDGYLKVNNAARANYESKTRLIMNCNCKLEKPMDNYALGCMALKDLFDHTFIRRLDMAAFIRKFADGSAYHRVANEKVEESVVSPEMLRHLIYFAWSLTPDRIEFFCDVTEYIMEKSMEMIEIYGKPDDISLVFPSDFRLKIARISVAWAVLSLSSRDKFKTILVLKRHVVMPEGAAVGEHSRFARFIGLLRNGVAQRRYELSRTLGYDFKWVEEAVNYLLDHNLVQIQADRVTITSKFNRVMAKMEKEDRAVFVQIRAASMNVEIEKTIKEKKDEDKPQDEKETE